MLLNKVSEFLGTNVDVWRVGNAAPLSAAHVSVLCNVICILGTIPWRYIMVSFMLCPLPLEKSPSYPPNRSLVVKRRFHMCPSNWTLAFPIASHFTDWAVSLLKKNLPHTWTRKISVYYINLY
jgi:hypothetical protein